jgi:hypothetical protein
MITKPFGHHAGANEGVSPSVVMPFHDLPSSCEEHRITMNLIQTRRISGRDFLGESQNAERKWRVDQTIDASELIRSSRICVIQLMSDSDRQVNGAFESFDRG